MKTWLQFLHLAPEPLTTMQRRVVWIAAILVAASRFMAMARSLWDWDEAQFASGLRDFDIAAHHPHPPGFPLFILAAKGVRLFVSSDFRALQTITMIGALALFPLMVWLTRELRMPFTTGVSAALLLSFAPNVWFFGGTAFSDVPSLALSLLAVALLLRGCRSTSAYLIGALVLAVAAGFRPQNLAIGMIPSLLATWYRVRATRSPVPLLLAVLIGGGTLGATYYGAAKATGDWQTYRNAVKYHQEYITTIDSIANPNRPALPFLFDDFFIRPYRMTEINIAVSLLCAVGGIAALIGRRVRLLATLAIFGPFCIFGWLVLDHFSASRFSIAWAPLVAISAAEGLAIVALLLPATRNKRWIAECTGCALVAGAMFFWTAPALAVVRRTTSPPMQAIEWIHQNVTRDTRLFVHGSMGPYASLLLSDYPQQSVDDDTPPTAPEDRKRPWLIREGLTGTRAAKTFTYDRGRLWQIARQRYFEVSVTPIDAMMRVGDGWYGEESNEHAAWHWMGARGTVLVPPIHGAARLAFTAYVPLDALKTKPTITVTLNGAVIDQFVVPDATFQRSYSVPSRADAWNEVVFSTSEFVNPLRQGIGGDPRDLGMRLDELDWSAASEQPTR